MDWIINNFKRECERIFSFMETYTLLSSYSTDIRWRSYGTPTSSIYIFQQSDSLYEAIQNSYSDKLISTISKMLQRS